MFCGGFRGYGFGASGSIGIGWMFLAMGFRILLFIGLIVLAVRLFRRYTDKSTDTLKILDERFARGEISEDEYLKRKAVLSQRS